MKKIGLLAVLAAFLLAPAAVSLACGITGQASRTDGSKVDGTVRVSTSFNGREAFPRGGSYTLELGDSACGERVEVYVNGRSIGMRSIPRSGKARVDVVMKGSTDLPVR
jgi:hypothetical protein